MSEFAKSLRNARGRWALRGVAAFGALALLVAASSASALTITGGPSYTLPGGGSCSVSGTTGVTGGATVTCSSVSLGSHSNVYFGIRNDINANGNATDGSGPTAGEIFGFSSSTATSITYTSSSSIPDAINGRQTVSNQLVLTLTSGSATVVSTGGTPADNGNGAIQRLFKITGGTSFTIRVDVQGSDPFFSLGNVLSAVFDPTHTSGATDISKVDLGFYYSDCGDGVVDSPEQCDLGGSNGSATSCCTSSCTYRGAGQTCRIGSGDSCDPNETCTGVQRELPGERGGQRRHGVPHRLWGLLRSERDLHRSSGASLSGRCGDLSRHGVPHGFG